MKDAFLNILFFFVKKNILLFFESNKYFITKFLLVEFILRVKKAMGRERNELLYLLKGNYIIARKALSFI
jgi:hypothetical protein